MSAFQVSIPYKQLYKHMKAAQALIATDIFFFLLPPQRLGKLTEGTCPSVRRRTSRSGPAKTLGGWAIVIPKTVWEEMEIGNKAEGMHTFLDTTRQIHFFGKALLILLSSSLPP